MPGFTVLIGIKALLSACTRLQYKGSWVDEGLGDGFALAADSGAFVLDRILLAWAPQPLTLCGLLPGVPHPTTGEATVPRDSHGCSPVGDHTTVPHSCLPTLEVSPALWLWGLSSASQPLWGLKE